MTQTAAQALLAQAADLTAAEQDELRAALVDQSRQQAVRELLDAVRQHAPGVERVRVDFHPRYGLDADKAGTAQVDFMDTMSIGPMMDAIEKINAQVPGRTLGLIMEIVSDKTSEFDGVYITVSDEPQVTGGRVYYD